jgi:hypothetical protein
MSWEIWRTLYCRVCILFRYVRLIFDRAVCERSDRCECRYRGHSERSLNQQWNRRNSIGSRQSQAVSPLFDRGWCWYDVNYLSIRLGNDQTMPTKWCLCHGWNISPPSSDKCLSPLPCDKFYSHIHYPVHVLWKWEKCHCIPPHMK